jgi:hypothetical protein
VRIQARGIYASAIHGRCGGQSSTTSRMEALLRPRCWSSAPCHHQVVRPRWSPGVWRRWIGAGIGCSGICAPFLDGDILRTPASGGGGYPELDCFYFFSSRVVFAYFEVLPSNSWFLSTSDVKGPQCKLYLPRLE